MSPQTALVIAADAWSGDAIGGAYKIASELASFAAGRGREVHYICPATTCAPGMSREQGVTIWRYENPTPGANALVRYRAHLDGARTAARAASARLGRAFVLNGHGPLPYYAASGCREAPACRRVMSVHSPLADEYRANHGDRLGIRTSAVHFALRRIEAACYARSDALQCFSKFTASRLAGSFRRLPTLTICPGYVDYAAMAIDLTRGEARRALASPCWQTEDLCFFSLRRHAPRMGLDRLIRAFAWLKRQRTRACRLILGGNGPQTPMLAEMARNLGLEADVHFVGRVEESRKALHYRAADCFVLPTSALEGFGLIVLEAFAAGTPVIATPVGAIPEVVDGLGTLAESADEDAIGRALLAFANDGDPGSDRARREYARSFDKETILGRLEAIVMAGAE